MNRIEKIVAVAGLILAIPLLGVGLYKGKALLTTLGLTSTAAGPILALRDGLEREDKRYKEYLKSIGLRNLDSSTYF